MWGLVIAGIIAVSATVAAWVYDSKTEKEREKQEQLKKKINSIRGDIRNLDKEFRTKKHYIYKDSFYELYKEYLHCIREYRKEKEKINEELTQLYNEINRMINNKNISPYLLDGLRKEKVLIEDAKRRLDAYFSYLAWFEGKLKIIEKRGSYADIFDLEPVDVLLPSDWLYEGKLVLLEHKGELNYKNRYGQKLELNSIKCPKTGEFDFTAELEAFNKYERDIPALIVSSKHPKNQVDDDLKDQARYFKCSIIKGELYVNHLIPGIPFVVKPQNEKINYDYNIYLYKDTVKCKMKQFDKKFPLKIYSPEDEIFVTPVYYDLLLKDIWVAEKKRKQEVRSIYPICLVVEQVLYYKLYEKISNNNNFHLINYDKINMKIDILLDDIIMLCDVKDSYIYVNEVKDKTIDNPNIIMIPFNFVLITKKEFENNKEFFPYLKETIFDFINFIDSEYSYQKCINDELIFKYDFINKWIDFIDYQIKNEEFDYKNAKKVTYSNLEHIRDNIIIFQLDNTVANKDTIKELENECHQNQNIMASLEIENKDSEQYELIPIGLISKENIDLDNLTIMVTLTNSLKFDYIVNPSKQLYLSIYYYPTHLYKQKHALIKFQNGELVNPELKKSLILPNLIKSTADPDEEKRYDSSVKYKNPDLTDNQKEVIKRALLEKEFFIIQGPPGTGKTTVIKEIVHQLLKHNDDKRVLIVSQQNVAVDNALSRVYFDNKEEWFDKSQKSIIRITANEDKIDETLKCFSIDNWFKKYKRSILDKIEKFSEYDHKLYAYIKYWYSLIDQDNLKDIDRDIVNVLLNLHQIVGATCVGFANKRVGIDRTKFDLVIIDEAARSTPPELIIPILRAKKVILIGDHYQLPPSIGKSLIDDIEEEKQDYSIREFLEKSFFEHLFENTPDSNKTILTEQFRMPEEVGNLISELFYDSKLKNGIIKDKTNFVDKKVIQWIDIKGRAKNDGTSKYNLLEVEEIKKLLLEIDNKIEGKSKKDVAIITPYSAQKKILKKMINDLFNKSKITSLNIMCDTVDGFQGKEADIVIYSVTKTDGKIDFIVDKKRLNVAISRTRENLYFIGHKEFLYNTQSNGRNYFREIIDYIERLNSMSN